MSLGEQDGEAEPDGVVLALDHLLDVRGNARAGRAHRMCDHGCAARRGGVCAGRSGDPRIAIEVVHQCGPHLRVRAPLPASCFVSVEYCRPSALMGIDPIHRNVARR